MKYFCCFICYAISLLTPVSAQRETTQWLLGNKVSINFNQRPPAILYDEQAPQIFSQQLASICDKDGNLLFYTDSQTVWNNKNQIMANGTNIGGERLRKVIIIPAPGKPGKYYIVTLGFINAVGDYFIDQHLVYALVDVKADSGAGAVVEKNKILYKNLHGSFTISAKCENDTYWLVGETNESVISGIGTDRIYAFRIDARGVSDTPVISSPVTMKSSGGYKFSPAADKIVFSYEGNGPSATVIADFDQLTGRVSTLRNIDACCSHVAEFSSNGKMLYLSQDSTLVQFDVSNGSLADILGSRKVIDNRGSYIGGLQLAPDGRIYISRANTRALSVIENPDQPGEACTYTPDGLSLPAEAPYYLPSFATNLLYNSPATTAPAGDDKFVCMNERTVLGSASQINATYVWEPASYLDNPALPNPTFHFSTHTDTAVVLTYQVTVNDGICPRTDRVQVTVQPLPEMPLITGSRWVCPEAEGIRYQVDAKDGYTYEWEVVGGTIIKGQGSTAIEVNWAKSYNDAYVQVKTTNTAGCLGKATFQVRINEVLQPELPAGAGVVCLNNKNGQVYQVTPAHGSVYTWGIKGGEIISGQGSSQVTVNWSGLGKHYLWLQEETTTKATVCNGVSDTLAVRVVEDSSSVEIQYVSVDSTGNNGLVEIQGRLATDLSRNNTLFLYRRDSGQGTWTRVAEVAPSGNTFSFTDAGIDTRAAPYQYKISTINFCNEPIESAMHQTIYLAAQVEEARQAINLSWNAYDGWRNPVAAYQLWRQLDEQETYTLAATVTSTQSLTQLSATDGFVHRYKVKAIERVTGYESWSNEVKLEFLHELYIPNVFTPNGDGANDSFEIKNIHLYPDNELVIYNRWGKEIYRKKGYSGEWQATGLPSGIYYYELLASRNNVNFKGIVHILK